MACSWVGVFQTDITGKDTDQGFMKSGTFVLRHKNISQFSILRVIGKLCGK